MAAVRTTEPTSEETDSRRDVIKVLLKLNVNVRLGHKKRIRNNMSLNPPQFYTDR